MEKITGIFRPPDDTARLDAVGPLAGYPIKIKKAIPAIIPFFNRIPQPKPGDWLYENDEDGQTFASYERAPKNSIEDKRKTIYIFPIEKTLDKEFLAMLKKIVKTFYTGMKVKVLDAIDITSRNQITSRLNQTTQKLQYQGHSIMNAVKNDLPSDGYGMMCILLTDMYNREDPDDYVYGLASKKNRIGIFSFARTLESFFEGLEEKREISPEMFNLCSVKVLIHEIGHLFGMKHCVFNECIMNGCYNYKEFESKPLAMCAVCVRKLHSMLNFNFVDYYDNISKVLEESGGLIAGFSKLYADMRDAVKKAYGPHYN